MSTPTSNSKQQPQPSQPPYGMRLIPQIVDDLALSDPNRLYASFPLSTDLSDGFRDVSFQELARAADATAWWLEKQIGRSDSTETIAYMGISDIRYAIMFLAGVKCGYKLFFPSPRNPSPTNVSLLESTACKIILYSAEMKPKVGELQGQMTNLEILPVAELDEILSSVSQHYPYHEVFQEALWKPVLILHSSGSTGTPKAVTYNHGTFSAYDSDRYIPEVPKRKLQTFCVWDFNDGGKFYSPFPAFHLAGVASYIVIPIMSSSASLVTGPPLAIPSGTLVNKIMTLQKLRAMYVPPTIVEQVMQEPEGFDRLKQLDFLIYTGGPLSVPVGDRLSKELDLCSYYGATEFFQIHTYVPHPEDWSYMEWIPTVKADMQPSIDGAYELVLHNDPDVAKNRPLYYNFPNFTDWHTKDLFKPHPTKPNLWQYHGRSDDIIVFSNGAKFSPVAAESVIQGHPSVASAIIVGTARSQAALIIEPKGTLDPNALANLIEEIWPVVERANTKSPTQGRVIRSMIAVASPEKPFPRAAKGTVVRHSVATAFASEIENLYAAVEGPGALDSVVNLTHDDTAIKKHVRHSVLNVLGAVELTDNDDLFTKGLDSVKTIELITLIRLTLGDGLSKLSPRTIYTNPTTAKLSAAIAKALETGNETNSVPVHRAEIDMIVKEYTKSLPQKAPRLTSKPPPPSISIALTGSTGLLGGYLLQSLIKTPEVAAIYCLDRSADAAEKHKKSSFASCLSPEQALKTKFIQVDFGLNQLGLPTKLYAELSDKIDFIIHNAWNVNFNMDLSSFAPTHIHGVRSLIDWSIGSDRNPHIAFLSSTSSVFNWPLYHTGPVPECHVEDMSAVPDMGYAQSKYVAEQILSIAGERCGVPFSVLRIGQIAGPVTTTGVWPKTEWFPALLKTSENLGLIPNSLPPVDWIPIDILSSVIMEMVHHVQSSGETGFYNVVNPHPSRWSSLIKTVTGHYGSSLIKVSMKEWYDVLKRSSATSEKDIVAKPALKIIDFFEGLASRESESVEFAYETQRASTASKTMAGLGPVNQEWMEIWLGQIHQ